MESSKTSVPIYRGEWLHPLNPQLLESIRQGFPVPPPVNMAPCVSTAPWLPTAPCIRPAPWLPTSAWLAPPSCLPMVPWLPVAPCLPPAPWLSTPTWLSPPPCIPTPSLPAYAMPVPTNWSPGSVPQSIPTPPAPNSNNSFPPPPYCFTVPPPPPYNSAPINPPHSASSPEANVSHSLSTPPPEYSSPPSPVVSVETHQYLSSTLNPDAPPYPSAQPNPASSTSANSPPPQYSSPASPSVPSDAGHYSSSTLNPDALPYLSASLSQVVTAYSTSLSSPPESLSSLPSDFGTEILYSTLNPAALPYPSPPLDSTLPTPPSDPWVPLFNKEEDDTDSESLIFRYAPYSEDPLFSSVWRPLPFEQMAFEKIESPRSGVNIDSDYWDALSDYEDGAVWSTQN